MLSRRPLPRGSETISVSSLEAMQHIGDASSKAALLGVLNVHNLERTDVLLTTSDDTHTTLILSLGDHNSGASLELNHVCCLASGNVHLHSVVHFGVGVGVPNGAAVVGGDIWHTLGSPCQLLATAKLVVLFLWEVLVVQPVHDETALGIVEHAEVLVGLVNGNNIHEATGVVGVGAYLAINFDETLHEDLLNFLLGEGVLETVPQNENERQALTQLVGTR